MWFRSYLKESAEPGCGCFHDLFVPRAASQAQVTQLPPLSLVSPLERVQKGAPSFPRPSRRCRVRGSWGLGQELSLPLGVSGDPRRGAGRRVGVCRDSGLSAVSQEESARSVSSPVAPSPRELPAACTSGPALWNPQVC